MRTAYIDPAYPDYLEGRLFDADNPRLNRDDYLRPFITMKARLNEMGVGVETADALFRNGAGPGQEYHSFGMLDNLDRVSAHPGVRLRSFVVFEPPVVAPQLYDALPELTRRFERVYVHNTHGDGYSLGGVSAAKLRKLWWPQQYDDVLEKHWQKGERLPKAVVVNNNKRPRRSENELYSVRIQAVAELAPRNAVDLYGGGWDRFLLRESRLRWRMWKPALRHRRVLRSVWKGAPASKFDVLARYEFCLCLENMRMDGFTTEKMWDCLYAGTIPIYLGPRDIASMVPPRCYVDASQFGSWGEAWDHARSLSPSQREEMRLAGREFIRGEASRRFKDSLVDILAE